MPRYELQLRVDAYSATGEWAAAPPLMSPEYEELEERARAVRVALARRFGIRLSGPWMQLAGDTPTLDAFVAELERMRDAREAAPGSIFVRELLTPDEEASCEWFSVRVQARGEGEAIERPYDGAYPAVRAVDLVDSAIAADGAFVNEHVARALREAGVTGCELVWARDRGKWAAPQWYMLIPTASAGRGVDHPWFDRAAWLEVMRAFGACTHIGMYRFDTRWFVRGWSSGTDALDRLLRMVTPGALGVNLHAPRRLLRERMPDGDVAWVPWDVARELGDVHTILVRRRVRDLLVERRLARPDDFDGVMLVDRAPGVTYLDDTEDALPPAVALEHLEQLRTEERRLRAAHDAKPRPERVADLARSLKLLRAAKKASPERFRKPARAAAIDAAEVAIGMLLPASWRALLAVTDGGDLHPEADECLLHSASELVAAQASQSAWVGADDPDFPARQFAVGWRADGDWYALDLSAVPAGERAADCPVVRWDHETSTPGQRWDSVADFMERVLAG